MKIKVDYLINEKTVLFYGVFYENGALYTLVIEAEEIFLVAMSPIKLIDHSLISYGSNFKGALQSSKKLLGEKRMMYPIKINATLDIWLFPTKSYKKENCAWFVLKHVQYSQPKGVQKTKVFLNYGHSIVIDMKESAFRDKRSKAGDLRDKITKNTENSLSCLKEMKKGFYIIEDKVGYKYIYQQKDK